MEKSNTVSFAYYFQLTKIFAERQNCSFSLCVCNVGVASRLLHEIHHFEQTTQVTSLPLWYTEHGSDPQ